MQIERFSIHTSEFRKSSFGITPEGFNSVDMTFIMNKLVLSMIDSKMLLVSEINKPVVASPAVRINHAVQSHLAANNRLQCGFAAIRNKFGIDLAVALKDAKDDGFSVRPATSSAFDPSGAKVGLIDFHFAAERRMGFTELRDPFPNSSHIPIHRIPIQARQGDYL